MKLYLMYGLIILINVIIFIVIKDKTKALRLTGLLAISSSILLIVLSFIAKLIINNTISTINLSNITNYLFKKFANMSIILFLIGIIEIIVSKYIYIRKKAKTL